MDLTRARTFKCYDGSGITVYKDKYGRIMYEGFFKDGYVFCRSQFKNMEDLERTIKELNMKEEIE